MCSNDEARELAEMLDKLFESGSAHINVTAEGEGILTETVNSTDCCKGNTACSVPTLHQGLDGEE